MNRARLAILAAYGIALLAPPLLQAQPRWTPIGPFGGTVNSLIADPSQAGVVYALAGEQGAFRSADAGASWKPIFIDFVTGDVAVDPVRPSTLYLVSPPQGVWKSTDSGASWAPANRGLPRAPAFVRTVAVDPADRNRLYAATSAGVFRSLDGGASWKLAGAGLPNGAALGSVSAVTAVRPAGTAFASTVSGLFRTTDGGNSWKKLTRGLPAGPIDRLQAAPSDPRTLYTLVGGTGLFRTSNGGRSWQRVQLPPPGNPLFDLAVDPRSPEIVYATVLGTGIFRSTDGARSWSALGSPGPNPAPIEPDPFTPRRLYLGLSSQAIPVGGIFRSDDGGATWQRRSHGLTALPVFSLGVAPDDPNAMWASAISLLFRTANRGRRWIPVPPAAEAIEVEAASATTAFFRSTGFFPIVNHDIWKTEDAGASWNPVLGPSARGPQVFLYRLAPSEASTLYAFVEETRNNFLRSIDGGDTWEARAMGLLACGVGDLAVAPSDASVLYATGSASTSPDSCQGARAGVLRSRDGGATWTDVGAGLPSGFVARAAVDPNDPDTVYVGFDLISPFPGTGVWRSTDGGATWRQAGGEIATQPIADLVATADPGRVYALLPDSRIVRSEDGGESWDTVTAGLMTREVRDLVADPGDPDRIYAVTGKGVWVLEE